MPKRGPTDESVMASLPRARPQRRSGRRADASRPPIAQPRQPRNLPPETTTEPPPLEPRGRHGIAGTALQATGEVARIGMSFTTQVVRGTLRRLTRR